MPKTRAFRFVVDAEPDAVRARLAARSHRRLLPAFGRFTVFASLPLAGSVGKDGQFNLATAQRDFFGLLRPVATGRLTAGPTGTVVEGVAGMPTWITWYLRSVYIALALATVVVGGLWAAGLAAGLAAVVPALAIGLLIAAVSIGLHVGNADAKVDALVEAVAGAVEAGQGGSGEVAAGQGAAPRVDGSDAAVEAARRASSRQAERPPTL
ncbi:MAG: hypothetical protein Q8P18_30680 [Pseudomonadota bacterium]|nr:hypothetical protein [Pseudomonadota bacterium]